MKLVSFTQGHRYLLAWAAALAIPALLTIAPRAGANELLYWANYNSNTVSVANIDGSGGGALNLAGAVPEHPEGLAYDTVTNRLFVASSAGGTEKEGQILFVNLDGSGAGVFSAPGAPVDGPFGIAVDPATRLVYWANGGKGPDSIAWARIDGSLGGVLNTAGATLESPYRVAIDPVASRVYWFNQNPEGFSYANADNSGGGGDVNMSGFPAFSSFSGLAVDPSGGRLYWVAQGGSPNHAFFANVAGGGGGPLDLAGATVEGPYGIALDPSLNKAYWGNYERGEVRAGAIGFAGMAGVPGAGGGITPLIAPVDGPQDPVIIKSPTAAVAPGLTRSPKSRQRLSCSQGEWSADYAGSFVYQSPRAYSYQWTRNGKPVAGAASNQLEATSEGQYQCFVTATNQAGLTAAGASPLKVNRAKLKVLVKSKKKKAKPGKKAAIKVQYYNQGDLKSKKPRVCVLVPKSLRRYLRALKCRKLGKIKGKGRRGTKLKVYVKPAAKHRSYKLKFVVKGVPSKRGQGRLKVVG